MLASICFQFRQKRFNICMNCSKGYMLRRNTGPHYFISSTKCTVRWTMTSKNNGGKNISRLDNILAISSCILSNSSGSTTFYHSLLKKSQRSMSLFLIPLSIRFLMATGRICVNITWQSCDFMCPNFILHELTSTRLLMFA